MGSGYLKASLNIFWMHALSSDSPGSKQESFPPHRFIVPVIGFDKKLLFHTCSVNTTVLNIKCNFNCSQFVFRIIFFVLIFERIKPTRQVMSCIPCFT
ncbi:hypothetical protein CDAR_64241 [Caerostris darwini]|uniref:Uncharacterized protein n=1 Tax=Caerostris darwini TaxID=1538125 RepID=A0AAV4QNW2_9ARAC|nr:hypothetical protein CDAR_64241 [Caerostris darwini]